MFKSRRQHPVAAVTKVIEIIRGNFITILVILFVGGSGDEQTLLNATWILGTILVLLVWGILSWLRFSYRIEEDQLIIEQGVLMRQKLYITKDRIQVIDITSGVLQRMFGLVEVKVKTAGSSSEGAKISAVSKEVANDLRSKLRKDQSEISEQEEAEEVRKIYRLGMKDLILAATTSGRLGVALSIVGTVFSQIDQVVTEQEMILYLQSVIPNSASTTLIVTSIIFILVVSWILSFLGAVITYGNFAVRLREDELIISHGIFERKQLTIPYNRIQAIQIKEELLRQSLGYATLKLDSAGYGDQGGKSVTLFPILPKAHVTDFIKSVLPEYDEEVFTVRPPQKSIRRYMVRMVFASMAIIIPFCLIFSFSYLTLSLVLPAIYLGYLQYSDAAIGFNKDTMILRYRHLSRNTVILKRHRLQTVRKSANPFQNRQGLADFTVTVASGREGHHFTVRDLEEDQVDRFWNWPSVNSDQAEIQPEESSHTLPAF